MAKQQQAMAIVQQGILYVNPAMVEEGVKALKEANHVATLKDLLPSYLPKGTEARAGVAAKQGERVNEHADKLVAALGRKNYTEVFAQYGHILGACNSCHVIVRQWK